MKFSKAFLDKVKSRISDIHNVEKSNPDASGQEFFEGMEDQEKLSQVSNALAMLSELEDKIWDAIDDKIDIDKIDDFTLDYNNIDYEEEAGPYIDSYLQDFRETDLQYYIYEYTDNDDIIEWQKEFLEMKILTEDLSSDPVYFNDLFTELSEKNKRLGKYFKEIEPDTEDIVEIINKHFDDGDFRDELVSALDTDLGDFYINKKDKKINIEFMDWVDDNKITDEEKEKYIWKQNRSNIEENIDESHYENVNQEIPISVKEFSNDSELEDILSVDRFYLEGNDGNLFSQKDKWEENVSPIVKEARELIKSLPTNVKKLVNERLPKGSEHAKKINEIKSYLVHMQVPSDVIKSLDDGQLEELRNDMINYNEYSPDQYRNIYYSEYLELKNKSPEELQRILDERESNKVRDEAESEDVDREKNKQLYKYKKDVEKKVEPLKDTNQQMMMGLVQRVKQKGTVSKQDLQQFFSKYKV